MKLFGDFFRSRLIDGLLIILPIGIVIVIGMKFLSILKPVADPMATLLPERFRYPLLLAVILLLLFSFATGLLALSRSGRKLGILIENSALNRVPGYKLVRSLTHSIGDDENPGRFAPAFVKIENSLVIGFVVEEHEDGRYTVFVPTAPTPAVGLVYVMDHHRVNLIDAPLLDAVKCISKFGIGSAELLKSMRQPLPGKEPNSKPPHSMTKV